MFPFDKPHNELVFENKNKMYGAYVIRREYDYALKISILVAAGFLGLIVTAGVIASNRNTTIPDVITQIENVIIPMDLSDLNKPDEQIEQKKIEKHKVKVTTTNPPIGEIKATDEVQKDNQEQKLTTDPVNPDLPLGDTDSTGSDEHDLDYATVTKKTVVTNEIKLIAPEMPDIEGGALAYVSSHIRYPEEAKEVHAQGMVHISFVVEKDGSISNITILNKKKVGYGCEEEAIRVIKSGKWKPGKNNGEPVRVQLTLPVRYQLQ